MEFVEVRMLVARSLIGVFEDFISVWELINASLFNNF